MDFRIAVKAVIVENEKILLIKRRPNDVHKPGQWDIPGGRLDIGENPWEGVKRETKEEIGLEIEPIIPFDIHHFTRDDGQRITMIFFLSEAVTSEIKLSEEHTEYIWVSLDQPENFPEWIRSVITNLKKIKLKVQ